MPFQWFPLACEHKENKRLASSAGQGYLWAISKGIQMSPPPSETPEPEPAAQLEIEVQEAIDLCGGDARAAPDRAQSTRRRLQRPCH